MGNGHYPNKLHHESLARLGYQVVDALGAREADRRGGFGVVYKIQRHGDAGFLAAKTMHVHLQENTQALKIFRNEVDLCFNLKPSPDEILNIPKQGFQSYLGYKYLALGEGILKDETSGAIFLLMEFVEGQTLRELLKVEKPLAISQVLQYGIQFCEGMMYCCAKRTDFIHRDIKPDNIMVNRKNEVKIIDFGFSKILGLKTGLSSHPIGTTSYMPPNGRVEQPQDDIYSFGITLGELLTGVPPLPNNHDIYKKTMGDLGVPAALVSLVEVCTKRIASNRIRSFQEIHERLLEVNRQIEQGTIRIKAEIPCSTCLHRFYRPLACCPICSSVPSLQLVITPSPLDFGDVPLHSKVTKSVYILVDKGTVIGVTGIIFEGPPFSLSAPTLPWILNDKTEIPISFKPEVHRPYRSMVVFECQTTQRENLKIELQLSGKGITPTSDEVEIKKGPFLKGLSEKNVQTILDKFGLSEDAKDTLQRNVHERIIIPYDFIIKKYPVTNAEYFRFVLDTQHPFPPHWNGESDFPFPAGEEEHPVTHISWYDATAFCQWYGVRLPTDWEWERAARGTDGRAYPWGNQFKANACNSGENGSTSTCSVYAYKEGKSPDGVEQTTGNVCEWTIPSTSFQLSIRGGSNADACEVTGLTFAKIYSCSRTTKNDHVGFRVVIPGQGRNENLGDIGKGYEMVYIPAGQTVLGCPENYRKQVKKIIQQYGIDEDEFFEKHPEININIPSFFIGKYPVTNQHYNEFLLDTGHRPPKNWGEVISKENWKILKFCPVVMVCYEDAKRFCDWLAPEARLPYGEEWEKSAKGNDARLYPWGKQFQLELCNSLETKKDKIQPVGSWPGGQSPYGVCDLVGNVGEMVIENRHVRGGSFEYTCEIYGLSSFIIEMPPHLQVPDVGFRWVKDSREKGKVL